MPITTTANQILRMNGADTLGPLPEQYWELIETHRADLIHQALAILGSLEDAEDVVQETFCEAFRHAERLAQVRSLRAYLRSINRANALNRLRDRRTSAAQAGRKQRELPPRLATTGGFSVLELREAIARAVETLPPKQRSVVVLRYLEHLSYEEIATRLKLNTGTVGWLLCEAALQLHGKLKDYVNAPPAGTSGAREEGGPP